MNSLRCVFEAKQSGKGDEPSHWVKPEAKRSHESETSGWRACYLLGTPRPFEALPAPRSRCGLGVWRKLFFISAGTSVVSPGRLRHQALPSYHHSQPLSWGACCTARCPSVPALSQGSFLRHGDVLGLFCPLVKRTALPSPVGPYTWPITVLQRGHPAQSALCQAAHRRIPHQLQRPETWGQARASGPMTHEPLTGYLVGPDIHSSSWGQAGANWAQRGQAAARVRPGSTVCHLHSLDSVPRAFGGSCEGSF